MRKIWHIWVCAALTVLALITVGCAQEPPVVETTAPTTEPTQPPTQEPTQPPTQPPAQPLLLTLPSEEACVTLEETLIFQGTADPRYPLEINGAQVQPDAQGEFTYEAPLELGENTVTVSYLDETMTFTAHRRYTTQWFAHAEGKTYGSGATIYAELFAREGSTVTIHFDGKEQTVKPSVNQLGSGAPEGFAYYVAEFQAPGKNPEDMDLGVITYNVTCDGITEVYTSGNIICAATVEMKRHDPEVTPDTGEYRDVGSGYIVEIVDINAETFNGRNVDDKSLPTMNYLPKGTVDYGTQGVYYNESARRYYYLLRCGVRVYRQNDNKPLGMAPVVDCYNGYLPDHNEIHVASFEIEDHFTLLTLDSLWKAPFFFDEEAQDYYTKNWQRFVLDEYDASYVDITFCYTTLFTGKLEIPEDHPLFQRAEIIENEADYTLRLYLKEPGKFYGWNAYYNEQDQLCFKFLNPVQIQAADNPYGADLTGLKVMVDVGHGGHDPGACYSDSRGHVWEEAERNLYLAQLVKQELEGIGATVVMNRSSDERTVTRTERIAYLLEQSPDFCICIHHNADLSSLANGYESWYFTAFSNSAARHVGQTNMECGAYNRANLAWHYYFMARQTACPIVLAENGYMSNKKEMDNIADAAVMQTKAQAIVQGIVNYYLEDGGMTITYSEKIQTNAG